MNPFQYATASTPDEAIALVGKNGRYLGGGIDLLDEMKAYIVSPDVLVDVKAVKDASSIRQLTFRSSGPTSDLIAVDDTDSKAQTATKPDMWGIGSLVTIAEIASHQHLQNQLSGLVEAASEVGSPQIRNVATLGGNLLQHSRCWYYRQPDIVCLKRGGQTCYGQDGENKYLSLFSGCACISPTVSNLATALTALDASIDISGNNLTGTPRKIGFLPIAKLYTDAWNNPLSNNSLKQGEFLTAVGIPTKRTRSAYRQISEKREFDWALVSCAAAGTVKDGKIFYPRVVLGAVAPVPYMVEEANKFLEGKPLNDETASKAADIILRDAKPLAQNGYKVPLAHTLIRRTLLALAP